jgi:DNA-binding MarR family transcriptional regulator
MEEETTMTPLESEFYEPSPLLRELQVLSILARDPEASQKEIAHQVGLAPSMVHNYIHHLAHQGFVEFRGPTRRQLRYIVTDTGLTRIEALSARHLTEAGRLIEKIQGRLLRAMERVARTGARGIGVLAPAALAQAMLRAAGETGLAARLLWDGNGARPAAPDRSALAGLDAVVVGDDQDAPEVAAAVRACREAGLPVHTLV